MPNSEPKPAVPSNIFQQKCLGTSHECLTAKNVTVVTSRCHKIRIFQERAFQEYAKVNERLKHKLNNDSLRTCCRKTALKSKLEFIMVMVVTPKLMVPKLCLHTSAQMQKERSCRIESGSNLRELWHFGGKNRHITHTLSTYWKLATQTLFINLWPRVVSGVTLVLYLVICIGVSMPKSLSVV